MEKGESGIFGFCKGEIAGKWGIIIVKWVIFLVIMMCYGKYRNL